MDKKIIIVFLIISSQASAAQFFKQPTQTTAKQFIQVIDRVVDFERIVESGSYKKFVRFVDSATLKWFYRLASTASIIPIIIDSKIYLKKDEGDFLMNFTKALAICANSFDH